MLCANASIQLHLGVYVYIIYFHIFTYTRNGFFPVGRVNGQRNEKAYVIVSIGKLFKANNAQVGNYTSSTNGAATAGILNHDARLLYDARLSMKFIVHAAIKKCMKLL